MLHVQPTISKVRSISEPMIHVSFTINKSVKQIVAINHNQKHLQIRSKAIRWRFLLDSTSKAILGTIFTFIWVPRTKATFSKLTLIKMSKCSHMPKSSTKIEKNYIAKVWIREAPLKLVWRQFWKIPPVQITRSKRKLTAQTRNHDRSMVYSRQQSSMTAHLF